MSMPEFLCPTTGKSCEHAQMTGEVLGRQVLDLFRFASSNVAQYGRFASLNMRIDPKTIENLQELERLAASDEAGVKDALVASRNDVVMNILPVFIECGNDESGNGIGCYMSEDVVSKKAAADGALSVMAEGMMNYLTKDKDNENG